MLSLEKRSEIIEYLSTVSEKSNVYIGTDSQVHKSAGFVRYTTAVVIHKNNCEGCRVLAHTENEPYTHDNLQSRLLMETQKTIEAYEMLTPYLETRHVEIHLDVNASKMYKSNSVAATAKGWAEGATGRPVYIKPYAFAASKAADAYVR